jgi:hypothetical protein
MNQFLFKPDNYSEWSVKSLNKIEKVIASCITEEHLDSAKVMIDHFILTMALNEKYQDEQVQDISKQLYLSLNLKRNRI